MKSIAKALIVFILAGMTAALPVRADIYVYIDAQGIRHFTNAPTSAKYKLYTRENGPRRSHFDSDRYDHLISRASQHHGLSFALLKSIIKVESDFNPRAVSKKGAKGLMQIMPGNFRLLQIDDPFDPWENIMGGARYFKLMLDRFDGRLPLALAAYNAGPLTVDQYQNIPPYRETRNYVKRVLRYNDVFKNGGWP